MRQRSWRGRPKEGEREKREEMEWGGAHGIMRTLNKQRFDNIGGQSAATSNNEIGLQIPASCVQPAGVSSVSRRQGRCLLTPRGSVSFERSPLVEVLGGSEPNLEE